jgi:hypothetical protein
MSRVAGTQAEDLGRTTAWVGIPAEVSDKAAAPERAVGIDGKTKKPGPLDPAFQNETTIQKMAKFLTEYRFLK